MLKGTVAFPTEASKGDDSHGPRKVALGSVYRHIMANLGYNNAGGVGARGAYANKWTKGDEEIRVGLKTAYDRYLNTADGMLDKVDKVMILAAKWDANDNPTHLVAYMMDSSVLQNMYNTLHFERAKCKSRETFTFIPLDKENEGRVSAFARITDKLLAAMGEPIAELDMLIRDGIQPHIIRERKRPGAREPLDTKEVTIDPLQGVEDPIATLKQLIAQRNNTTVDKVKVLIEA